MSIVVFEDQAPDPGFDPGRADVACFVGYVRLLGGAPLVALPSALETWFSAQGWTGAGTPASRLLALEDVPVPIDSLAGFAARCVSGSETACSGPHSPIPGSSTHACSSTWSTRISRGSATIARHCGQR